MEASIKSRTINDLPNELLMYILEHLQINDLIQCSLVCRSFKLICKNVKIPELIISDKIENIRDLWFYTNKRFNHKDAIDVKTFCRHRSTFGLEKVKRLYFTGYKTEYDLLSVNNFTQLEQIRIGIKEPDDKFQLNVDLPNLKIAEINSNCYLQTFHVTAPKLEMLKCFTFDGIHLVHPETVKHLDMNIYTDEISVLNNLQSVQFLFNYINSALDRNVISILPRLSTIAFVGSYLFNNWPSLQECLYNLFKEKLNLRVKIFVECVEIDSTTKIDEFYCTPTMLFHFKNYDSLTGDIVGVTIDYNQLMHLTEGQIPDDFTNKYFNTRSIQVTEKVENPKHLSGFLNSFDYLSELHLNSTLLDQSFYDRLDQLNQLRKLVIKNSSPSILNYDFLLRLNLLEWFETDSESPKFSDLALALFSGLKYFRIMKFFLKEEMGIMRQECNKYFLYCHCKKHLPLKVDFDGLFHAIGAYSLR